MAIKKTELICIGCPVGCRLTAETDGDAVLSVTGNECPIGERYAREELVRPTRIVTALVQVEGEEEPLPVKVSAPIDKRLIFDCLEALGNVCVRAPVEIGDVLVKNICNSGVDVVATKRVLK